MRELLSARHIALSATEKKIIPFSRRVPNLFQLSYNPCRERLSMHGGNRDVALRKKGFQPAAN
jgi:hypothetical protein